MPSPSTPPRRYLVLDFEATCDVDGPPSPQEIIEFPSILLDGTTMREIDRFESFVRPVVHPELTRYCTTLTGITTAQVQAAPRFAEVYAHHRAWMQAHDLLDGNVAVVTCGDRDLAEMLPTQCALLDPPMTLVEPHWRRWINLKRSFATVLGVRPPSMHAMMEHLALRPEGRHHRGIDDCHNIARIAAVLARSGPLDYTSRLSPKAYPPISLRLQHGGVERAILLHRRTHARLMRHAVAAYRVPLQTAHHQDAPVVVEDLQDGDLIVVA